VSSVIALWVCIGLFFARVVGQIEVLLVEPAWLPPMSAWYSGLLPYPVLLPAQIALLMLMAVLAFRPAAARRARVWRTLALLYFAVMAVRLAICVNAYGSEFYLHGAIPIAFHWVLALFALVTTRGWTTQAARQGQ
jgi:hypothetical protein